MARKLACLVVDANDRTEIKTNPDVGRKFVLLKTDTEDAKEAGLDEANENLGVLDVTFTPQNAVTYRSLNATRGGLKPKGVGCFPTSSSSAAGTAYGEASSQRFRKVKGVTDLDPDLQRRIAVRLLVTADESLKKYVAVAPRAKSVFVVPPPL
jgi:hypothetical protein